MSELTNYARQIMKNGIMLSSSTALRIIEQLEAAEQRIAELENDSQEVARLAGANAARAQKAEAELARRDASAGEPVYQVGADDHWYDVSELVLVLKAKQGAKTRVLFTAAQPSAPVNERDL